MSREKILTQVKLLPSDPIVFQVDWDGDSTSWFVCLSAQTSDGQSHHLGTFSEGGDIRLFNGQVPPWPEAIAAQQLGAELAQRYGAEFYFPSPNHPKTDCPDWKDRNKGYPCSRCGILLLQAHNCPWHGLCFHCHLDEEHEEREAKWTPEQRWREARYEAPLGLPRPNRDELHGWIEGGTQFAFQLSMPPSWPVMGCNLTSILRGGVARRDRPRMTVPRMTVAFQA